MQVYLQVDLDYVLKMQFQDFINSQNQTFSKDCTPRTPLGVEHCTSWPQLIFLDPQAALNSRLTKNLLFQACFICSTSKTTLLSLFHSTLNYTYVPKYNYQLLEIKEAMTKQQARLLSFLSCLLIELGWYVIELGWHVIMHVIQIKQLRFLYFMICDFKLRIPLNPSFHFDFIEINVHFIKY